MAKNGYLNNVKLADRDTPDVFIPLDSSCFTYENENDERFVLAVTISRNAAGDGGGLPADAAEESLLRRCQARLGKDFTWYFITSVGLYGAKDVCGGLLLQWLAGFGQQPLLLNAQV